MRDGQEIAAIIPALDEAEAIGHVVAGIPPWVDRIIVVDNGSRDATGDVARQAGAEVYLERERGYGAACLKGLAQLSGEDIVVFLDGDNSDNPRDMAALVDPIASGEVDFVVGSRVAGKQERGALTPQQRYGNALACWLMRMIWRIDYTDLGPFRAIRRGSLETLGMADRNFGWTIEMQIRAVTGRLRVREVPVAYRNRIGRSKVSGTIKGTIMAGTKILYTVARFALAGKGR